MITCTQPPSSYGPGFAEAIVEDASLDILGRLGYAAAHGPGIAPDTSGAERASYGNVILRQRLVAAVDRINPAIPADARAEAIKQVLTAATPSLVEENRRIHKLIAEGVDVEFDGDDGVIKGGKVRLIDFDDVAANDWLAVNQYTVIENRNDRRPDVVVFVNDWVTQRLLVASTALPSTTRSAAAAWSAIHWPSSAPTSKCTALPDAHH